MAWGFSNIVPNSGNNNPYEPEFSTYPPLVIADPLDPETIWNTLEDPKKVWILTSFELSVNSNKPPEPDRAILNVPGNMLSLYLALSTLNS